MAGRYHGEGDENHEIVQIEMEEMELAIETSGSDKVSTLIIHSAAYPLMVLKRWYDYRELFNSRATRHRSFLVLCVGFFGQLNIPPTR